MSMNRRRLERERVQSGELQVTRIDLSPWTEGELEWLRNVPLGAYRVRYLTREEACEMWPEKRR